MNKMSETMYITGVVIANGIPDSDGDVLDKKDIKTIFTKFLDQSSDVLHDRIKHDKVHVLANWITGVDVEIAGKIAPAGSWLTTLAVDNEEIKTAVNNKELNGLSLGSVSEDALTREKWFINKAMSYKRLVNSFAKNDESERKTYSDLDDIDEVHPFWISIVDVPANQFAFEVDNYTAFINKRASEEVDTMTNEGNEMQDRISIAGWGKITDIFRKENSINKSEEETEPVEEPTEEKSDDISNKELLEAMPKVIAEGFKIALNEMKDAEQNEEDIDKSEESAENESEESTEETKPEDSEKDDDIDKSETGKSDYIDETSIDKRQTQMPNTTIKAPSSSTSDFYKRTGRDAMGRKIRN